MCGGGVPELKKKKKRGGGRGKEGPELYIIIYL